MRVITWPEPALVTTMASISGASTRPELVAESPSAPCMNSGTKTIVKGSVTGKANTKVYIELYSTASSDTEGKTLLETISVKTNSSGNATFELDVDKLVAGTYVTATVTSADGATSEFAKAVKVA